MEVLPTRYRLPDEETAMFNHAVAHESLSLLKNALERLAELVPRLHEANERCARAEEPLAHLSEKDLRHMPQLAAHIRAANQELESVTGQIEEVLDLIG
jgi:hypothetical protein